MFIYWITFGTLSLCLCMFGAAYEDLQRAFDKANKLADKGDPKDWPPQFFIRCLVEVDDFVNEVILMYRYRKLFHSMMI